MNSKFSKQVFLFLYLRINADLIPAKLTIERECLQSLSINRDNKFIMRKLFLLFVLFTLTACDQGITDDVLDPDAMSISVLSITAPGTFILSETNTDLITSIELTHPEQIDMVWFEIKSADGSTDISDIVLMRDDGSTQTMGDQTSGDNIYTGKFTFDPEMSNGQYLIEYFVEDNINYEPDNTRLIASNLLDYLSGEPNQPPVISDLNIRSSVTLDEVFIFSVKASDPNGLNDIQMVYFELYRPDGTVVIDSRTGSSKFQMWDNGDLNGYGDATAGDGTFSFKNSFSGAQLGTWRFEFQAVDNADELSNKIIQNVEVTQ